MTPTEIGWEDFARSDRATLYTYAKASLSKLWMRSSRVCDVVRRPTPTPFGPAWWVSFAVPIDNRYDHGPYRTKDEAKAMAITLWRMT
jgi:hypothetical protein